MLLRSASTPVLGSLVSSVLESPSNLHSLSKSPYHPHHQIWSFSLTTISCNSSPISPSIGGGIRRARSDGNLEGLALGYDDCQNLTQPKKIQPRQKCLMLETIPSFSIANLNGSRCFEEEDEDDWSETDDEEEGIQVGAMANLSTRADVGLLNRSWNAGFEGGKGVIGEDIYHARGLETDDGDNNGDGFGGGGGGGGQNGGFHWTGGGDGGDKRGRTEEYYKLMVKQNPANSLFLRNYAQFLYEMKRDYKGAEEYYSRAILADPEDGEILSQYAKLIWESSGDQDKASLYHERAVQASPQDSNVHAAYASFLWGLEEDEDEMEMVASHGA